MTGLFRARGLEKKLKSSPSVGQDWSRVWGCIVVRSAAGVFFSVAIQTVGFAISVEATGGSTGGIHRERLMKRRARNAKRQGLMKSVGALCNFAMEDEERMEYPVPTIGVTKTNEGTQRHSPGRRPKREPVKRSMFAGAVFGFIIGLSMAHAMFSAESADAKRAMTELRAADHELKLADAKLKAAAAELERGDALLKKSDDRLRAVCDQMAIMLRQYRKESK